MTQPFKATLVASGAEPLDRDELHRLYLLHQRALYAFFANRGFGREEARDLLQQTFLEAWRCRDAYQSGAADGQDAGGWLFGIAKNVWRMHLRSQSRQMRAAEEVPIEHHENDGESGRHPALQLPDEGERSQPLDKCLAEEESRLLHQALLDLPERMRFCVVLSLRGYKYREIADLLKVSLNTVRKQLFDGRERLRAKLGPYFSGIPGET